jgi:hypothetical protein
MEKKKKRILKQPIENVFFYKTFKTFIEDFVREIFWVTSDSIVSKLRCFLPSIYPSSCFHSLSTCRRTARAEGACVLFLEKQKKKFNQKTNVYEKSLLIFC